MYVIFNLQGLQYTFHLHIYCLNVKKGKKHYHIIKIQHTVNSHSQTFMSHTCTTNKHTHKKKDLKHEDIYSVYSHNKLYFTLQKFCIFSIKI